MTKTLRSLEPRDQRLQSFGKKCVAAPAHLVDTVAFVDKLVLSVDGELSGAYDNVLIHAKSQGIFHPDALYSRRLSGAFWVSGNRVVVLHGRTKKFQNVPPLRITMHSGRTPLTAAEAILLTRRVTLGSPEIRISSLEFTFEHDDQLRAPALDS